MSSLRKKGVRHAYNKTFDRFFKRSSEVQRESSSAKEDKYDQDAGINVGMQQSDVLIIDNGDFDDWECMSEVQDGTRLPSSLHATSDPCHLASSSVATTSSRVGAEALAQETISQHSKLWTCGACTFSGNLYPILRCSVCDTLKGYVCLERDSASVSAVPRPPKLTRAGTIPIDLLLTKKPKNL